MNTIDRHITAYIFGCLSGDFGWNYESTREILLATEHNPENPFLRAVLGFCKKYNMDDPDIRKAVAETAQEYFENPNKYQEKERTIAVWSKKGSLYFFTVHTKKELLGIVITDQFSIGASEILKKYPDVGFVKSK